jgi:putative lipoic acid-binding regulatory protein|tara:strand:- start:399608 stop:400000 length:393 start_codon:yes stop_codon:yes gene_type:complete
LLSKGNNLFVKIRNIFFKKKYKQNGIFVAYKIGMNKTPNPEEFYAKLKSQLEDTATWPNEYLYKFIVLSDLQKIAEVEAIFDNMGSVIKTKESSNGKYTSISINVTMRNPDHVIEKYLEVTEKVEGVISL